MPRVTLVEQSSYEYSHPLIVRTTDINSAGHLGNDAMLGLVQEARVNFLKVLHFNTIVRGRQRVGLIIGDLAMNFKAEAFAFDQLSVDCQIDELREKSFRLFYRVRRGDQLIALVETGMIAYDYLNKKAVELPSRFLKGLHDYRTRIKSREK